jgi:hypothetical protein
LRSERIANKRGARVDMQTVFLLIDQTIFIEVQVIVISFAYNCFGSSLRLKCDFFSEVNGAASTASASASEIHCSKLMKPFSSQSMMHRREP